MRCPTSGGIDPTNGLSRRRRDTRSQSIRRLRVAYVLDKLPRNPMKKRNAKHSLHLNKETIRILNTDGLGKVVGGISQIGCTHGLNCTETTNCGDSTIPSCKPQ
jgi:hypothetical protein